MDIDTLNAANLQSETKERLKGLLGDLDEIRLNFVMLYTGSTNRVQASTTSQRNLSSQKLQPYGLSRPQAAVSLEVEFTTGVFLEDQIFQVPLKRHVGLRSMYVG